MNLGTGGGTKFVLWGRMKLPPEVDPALAVVENDADCPGGEAEEDEEGEEGEDDDEDGDEGVEGCLIPSFGGKKAAVITFFCPSWGGAVGDRYTPLCPTRSFFFFFFFLGWGWRGVRDKQRRAEEEEREDVDTNPFGEDAERRVGRGKKTTKRRVKRVGLSCSLRREDVPGAQRAEETKHDSRLPFGVFSSFLGLAPSHHLVLAWLWSCDPPKRREKKRKEKLSLTFILHPSSSIRHPSPLHPPSLSPRLRWPPASAGE